MNNNRKSIGAMRFLEATHEIPGTEIVVDRDESKSRFNLILAESSCKWLVDQIISSWKP
ncbi:MAG TPA: hypothetical protein P5307_29685 [Pirellulaceae bacterium]|nr:hypothetical protein [Pirellulaceae bacterium]